MEKYYLVLMSGCIEPYLIGPFDTEEEQIAKAKEMFKSEVDEEDCLFGMDIDNEGNPDLWAFSGGFVQELLGSLETEEEK